MSEASPAPEPGAPAGESHRLSQQEIWFGSMAQTPTRRARVIGRFFLSLFHRWILDVRGLDHLAPEGDPVIVALNHNQRLEALLIPILLIHQRKGKLIRFLADWNFLLVPIVASYYRLSRVIVVTRKAAKPAFLNRLKPLFEEKDSAMDRALVALAGGDSVGIFPEGTMNRDPRYLKRGSPSAARLSLESGAPIVPVGIRFPKKDPDRRIGDFDAMSLEIGAPLVPAQEFVGQRAPAAEVRAWHDQLMDELARLSGKQWPPPGAGG